MKKTTLDIRKKSVSSMIAKTLSSPSVYLFLCILLSVYLLTDIGFHKWHGSHLTPHLLGVSLNLSETNLLCNSLQDGCDSYHRHPPLYFYINYLISHFSWSADTYVKHAMTASIIFNYVGVFALMQIYGGDKTEKFFVILFTTSSLLFVVNLTLSSYDSLIILMFAMYAVSEKYDLNRTAYIAIFISVILSWYFVLAGTLYTLYRFYRGNYQAIFPYTAGLIITITFLMNDSEKLYENFTAATENIDFSPNANSQRQLDLPNTIRMLIVNLVYTMSPVGLLIGGFGLMKPKNLIKTLAKRSTFIYFPLLVFLIWNTIFFRWSLIHNFVYLMLIPFLIPIYLEILRTLSSKIKLLIIFISLATIFQIHKTVIQGYDNLSNYTNEGVEIFMEATHRDGNPDN